MHARGVRLVVAGGCMGVDGGVVLLPSVSNDPPEQERSPCLPGKGQTRIRDGARASSIKGQTYIRDYFGVLYFITVQRCKVHSPSISE